MLGIIEVEVNDLFDELITYPSLIFSGFFNII